MVRLELTRPRCVDYPGNWNNAGWAVVGSWFGPVWKGCGRSGLDVVYAGGDVDAGIVV